MMSGGDELSERVMQVVADGTGWNRRAITPDSRIEVDLGCTGDHARELLLRFEREFGVDMSAVEFDKHFNNEASSGWPIAVALVVALPLTFLSLHVLGALARSFGWTVPAVMHGNAGFVIAYACLGFAIAVLTKLVSWRSRKVPITVRHLIDAAQSRRWPLT